MSRAALAFAPALLILLAATAAADDDGGSSIESRLLARPVAELAEGARTRGDARRGALIFHRPILMCARCHAVGGRGGGLGPDLAAEGVDPSAEHIVASILRPSLAIREGFETTTLALADGRVVSGLIAERGEAAVMLRPADRIGEREEIAVDQIDEERRGDVSLMPAGLVNALADRQEFLDLVRYVAEVAVGGPERARELDPPPSALEPPSLPEYESRLDHAGLIASLDPAAFERGRVIYGRLCVNCHGTPETPGSLPGSRRFASEPLKNGADPYALYRTLTHGFGQMEAQTTLVPRQKYDVIHYLREAYLAAHNPSQFVRVDRAYLRSLPQGDTRGPEPSLIESWAGMDYGPFLSATIEVGADGSNFAMKGLAVRLDPGPGGVARGQVFALLDTETLRMSAAWTGPGLIDWRGIQFDGTHGVHPRIVGDLLAVNPDGPGWADPATGSFDDPRPLRRDGRPYGPLPRSWARYRGLFRHNDHAILSYQIGSTPILETVDLAGTPERPVVVRRFELGRRDRALTLRVARHPGASNVEPTATRITLEGPSPLAVGLAPNLPGASWSASGTDDLLLTIPSGEEPLRFAIGLARPAEVADPRAAIDRPDLELAGLTQGGPPRWPDPVVTDATIEEKPAGPFAVDTLASPQENPWAARVRPTGFDFLDGDRVALCTWDGDVWIVSGLDRPDGQLSWRRYFSGLYQPLGLVVRDGEIFVNCRDQLARLRDLNDDGEADLAECFNGDHQVTEHFHEFAMGLQIDEAGNFYYAKAARHALPATLPQHGTLLKVAADGSSTEILATGFRAPNGVLLNPDGTFYVTDQEGHWTPKNRVNLVRRGGFYGNMMAYHDVTDPSDDAMEPPVLWITNAFDRSPSELLRVPPETWGPLAGSLLNFSYGYGKTFVISTQTIDGATQGVMAPLPIRQLPTGTMRGRFRASDGNLYVCGMFSWAGNQQHPGDFYRYRYLGGPIDVPVGFEASPGRLLLTFSDPLDDQSLDPSNFVITAWSLRRTANYGSKHENERRWEVTDVRLSDDRRTLHLTIPELSATQGLEILYRLRAVDARPLEGSIHGTILGLPPEE